MGLLVGFASPSLAMSCPSSGAGAHYWAWQGAHLRLVPRMGGFAAALSYRWTAVTPAAYVATVTPALSVREWVSDLLLSRLPGRGSDSCNARCWLGQPYLSSRPANQLGRNFK